jgi:hypothetical protein
MSIHPFFACVHMLKSRGAAAAKSGFQNERAVHAQIQRLNYNGERVQVSEPAGANKNAQDHTLLNCGGLAIESKTAGAFEGGARTMKYRDGAFQPPDHSLLREMVLSVTPLPLWGGFVPSCMKGDKSEATWLTEKEHVKEIKGDVPSAVVADYYREKGTHYIQVEGMGLYHTGEDIQGWGVPKFEPTCKIRIRMKQHGSGTVPQDCQASFNYNKRSLPSTPYNMMDMSRLPPGFTPVAE